MRFKLTNVFTDQWVEYDRLVAEDICEKRKR